MSRYLLLACFGVMLLGVGIFGAAQMAEAKKQRASVADLVKDRDALRKQVWDLQKLNKEVAARPEREYASAAGGTTVAGDNVTPERPAALARVRPEGGAFANAMNSPEVQQLMSIQQKAGLDGRYASLFRKLNLSPAELDNFKTLLVDKQSAIMDVMAAARTHGMTGRENRDEIRLLVEDTQAEIDGNIRTTLGDAAYAEYKNYETTLPQRGIVSQLEQRLSYTPTPLNDTQAEQLVQILATNASASDRGNRAGNTGALVQVFTAGNPRLGQAATFFGGSSVPITDNVIVQAQGVLAPAQVAALQGLQQEQQAAAQLMQQMRSSRGGGPQGSTGGNGPQPSNPTSPPRN